MNIASAPSVDKARQVRVNIPYSMMKNAGNYDIGDTCHMTGKVVGIRKVKEDQKKKGETFWEESHIEVELMPESNKADEAMSKMVKAGSKPKGMKAAMEESDEK